MSFEALPPTEAGDVLNHRGMMYNHMFIALHHDIKISVQHITVFHAFNGRRVPNPTRRLLEGWETGPWAYNGGSLRLDTERKTMATVSEIDDKLDELKRQATALKEQRKVAAAKEREQARKWRAATLTAIGESVLKALDADWTAIDLEGLRGWLDGNAGDIRLAALTEPRTPASAKDALDAFKRASRAAKSAEPVEPVEAGVADGAPAEDSPQDPQPDWR